MAALKSSGVMGETRKAGGTRKGGEGRKVRESGGRYRVARQPDTQPVRVNARLDPISAAKLESIMALTGKSVTEALKAALDAYLAGLEAKRRPRPQELALRVGLIGCGEGPEDLSSRHKAYLAEGLSGKHDHR